MKGTPLALCLMLTIAFTHDTIQQFIKNACSAALYMSTKQSVSYGFMNSRTPQIHIIHKLKNNLHFDADYFYIGAILEFVPGGQVLSTFFKILRC